MRSLLVPSLVLLATLTLGACGDKDGDDTAGDTTGGTTSGVTTSSRGCQSSPDTPMGPRAVLTAPSVR